MKVLSRAGHYLAWPRQRILAIGGSVGVRLAGDAADPTRLDESLIYGLPDAPDFAAYKVATAALLAGETISAVRLDCLNPVMAMSKYRFAPTHVPSTATESTLEDARAEATSAWLRATGMGPLADLATLELISGVREGLRAIFAGVLNEHGVDGVTFAIPQDVYPRYIQMLQEAAGPDRFPLLRITRFQTLQRDAPWSTSPLSPPEAARTPGRKLEVTVLPLPLHPTGRWPTPSEITVMRKLAQGSGTENDSAPRRLLLLDCVYTYDYARTAEILSQIFTPLGDRESSPSVDAVALFSLSKGWLAPSVDASATQAGSASSSVGWALVSPAAAGVKDFLAASHQPPSAALVAAAGILTAEPALPQRLNRRFAAQWRKLAPLIRAHGDPLWAAPETGYLGVLRSHWRVILRAANSSSNNSSPAAPAAGSRLLAVPASVFGSQDGERSVVSCLYDIAADDADTAARTYYYITTLSNFGLAFDPYARAFDKKRLPRTTFPGQVFVLRADALSAVVTKATRLLAAHGIEGDSLVAMEARLPPHVARALQPAASGVGLFFSGTQLPVERVFPLGSDTASAAAASTLLALEARSGAGCAGDSWAWTVEDAMARALRLLTPRLTAYEDLRPLTVSVLPIANGCQARCAFCFSEASVSVEQRGAPRALSDARVVEVLRAGRAAGAVRAVITGGGEPSMLPTARLEALVRACAAELPKVVLISNGYVWGAGLARQVPDAAAAFDQRTAALRRLREAGLTVLAVSRHGPDSLSNTRIMALDTGSDLIPPAAEAAGLTMRWVCVLQRGGVEDATSLRAYVDWAAASGVHELCFKELYVSSSAASRYYSHAANLWARERQVPLRLVVDWCDAHGFTKVAELPWGVPIYAGTWRGAPLSIAAYTEPSVVWERTNPGHVARSWNLMASGECLASLEDAGSTVCLPRETC